MHKLPYFIFSALVLIGVSSPVFSLPAFPGAEGFGSETPGGRGGTVIEVTNLNDSGAGSLRAALTASSPRIVVFRVAGTINLLSRITVTQPYLTVAGQTAPGDGITIKNDVSNGKGPIRISTHDVVLRYLRVRSGPSPNDGGTLDAFNMYPAPNVYNIVADHCSFSWSTDEVFQTGGAHDFTVQWSIIAEGLNYASHPEGAHSKGMHFEGANSDNISIHHNLLAHNYDRNPYINTTGIFDLVNNVFFNATRWTEIKDTDGEPNANIIGNYYKLGPSSGSGGYEVFYYNSMGRQPRVYVQGNIGFHRPSNDLNENLIVQEDSRWMIVGSRFPAPPVATVSAFEAFNSVLDNGGAILPVRDAHDTRVMNDVRNGTGQLIDDPSQVGGWLVMNAETPPADTDHDGMPDDWEGTYGFNFRDATDGSQDADGDGYTNIEEYLYATDPGSPSSDTTPPVRSNGSPSGTLPAGTTQTNLGLTTNESATCRYSTASGSYDSMTPFDTSGGTSHSTPISGLVNGNTYTFFVRCRDGTGNVNLDDFTISFTIAMPFNQPPTVTAGTDQTITLPDNAILNGTVTDDGLPAGSIVTITWSQVSGPGTVSFADPHTANTTASFSADGTYVLRLTADDSALTAFDEVTVTVKPPAGTSSIDVRVSRGSDDAEQLVSSGAVRLTSSDLELTVDGTNQTVGLRFNSIAIPKGAIIQKAYIQFTVDETPSAAVELQIWGQAADNSPTFTTAKNNISSRLKTAASVAWSPAAWPAVGDAGIDQRTPDLKAVIQEIVNRGAWANGNSLTVIITGNGTGKRVARAYDFGVPTAAALLHVEYN